MQTESPQKHPTTPDAKTVRVKIFGVGTAGVTMLEAMSHGDFAGASFVAVNADHSALAASSAAEKIHLDSKTLRGLGTGGDPERGRELAEAHAAQLKSLCAGADVVFLVAGLGGGAGTGIAPGLGRGGGGGGGRGAAGGGG